MNASHPSRHRLLPLLVACGLTFAGAVASAKGRETAESAGGAAAPEREVKSPGAVAAQVCAILQNRKTPWQIYATYTDMFLAFARRVEMEQVGTRDLKEKQKRLVLHYRGMAGLLQQMQACAEVRDGIKHNRTDVPFGRRASTYEEQGKQHGELLLQFAKMGSRLPGFELPKSFPRKR